MNWIPIESYLNECSDFSASLKSSWKKVSSMFLAKYPTVEDWLNSDKEPVKFRTYNETHYVIYWFLNLNELDHIRLRDTIAQFLISRTIGTYKYWTIKYGYISEKEWFTLNQFPRQQHRILNASIPLFTIYHRKALKDLERNDFNSIPSVYEYRKHNDKLINDYLITLGYSSTIITRNYSSRSNWTSILFSHEKHGQMFEEYHRYLTRANAKEKYLSGVGAYLVALLEFLTTKGMTDCSNFTEEEFTQLTEYLLQTRKASSVSIMIAKYKKFFQWGAGYNDFFSNQLMFPDDYWSKLMKKGKKENEKSDGRAFRKEGIAEGVVNALKNFTPQNEIEELCLGFWKIVTSTPARQAFILNLEAFEAIKPVPNKPDLFGVYSKDADKAGNKGGQFPLFDPLGIEAIYKLQARAKRNNFTPIYNKKSKRKFIHLFQLSFSPWLLKRSHIWSFFNDKIKLQVAQLIGIDEDTFEGGSHGFRHYILTHIVKKTGSIATAQAAAGHKNSKITYTYLRSKHSRKALLYRAIDKFEKGEITGKFYIRLVELLTNDSPDTDMMKDLTKEMTMAEYISKHGRRTEMGYCFKKHSNCKHYLKCWGCSHFLLTREEIEGGVKLLSNLIEDFNKIKHETTDFSYETCEAENKFLAIGLIIERLKDLGFSEEEIHLMVVNASTLNHQGGAKAYGY